MQVSLTRKNGIAASLAGRGLKWYLSGKWIQTLLFLSSLVFGLLLTPIGGKLTGDVIDSVDRATVAVLLLLSFVVIVAANTAVALNAQRRAQDEKVENQIARIARTIGLRAEFLHEGSRREGQDAYTVVRQMVQEATSEILILDHRPSLTASRFYDQTPPESQSRLAYYEELSKKAVSKANTSQYFRYKRIVQLEEGPTARWDTSVNQDQCFAEHCREIIRHRDRSPMAVCSITTARVFFPRSSIIIVDGRQVLIELAIVGPSGDARVEGDLLFYDPEGVLAGPLNLHSAHRGRDFSGILTVL